MERTNAAEYSLSKIPKLIQDFNSAKSKATKEGNVHKAAFYQKLIDDFTKAQSKIEQTIDELKKATEDPKKSFYESSVKDKESLITLAWLQEKLLLNGITVNKDIKIDETIEDSQVKYDFSEKCKQACNEMGRGKGIWKVLFGSALGIGLADVATKGVTSLLVKKGVKTEVMGLFGLGKLGVSKLPELWSAITGGLSTFWGFSPVGLVSAAAIVGLAAIPLVKKVVDKAKAKNKENHKVEKALEDTLAAQDLSTLG